MGRGKNWTKAEESYLAESWGTVSLDGLCEHLGRSRNAIKIRAFRLGLGAFWDAGEYVTLNQLLPALGYGQSAGSYTSVSWVQNRGLPVHRKKCGDSTARVVYLHEFWEWAEKYRSFLDFSKMEPLSLGKEPEWVTEQRRHDCQSFTLQRKDPWSRLEDEQLIYLVKQQRYGYKELSERLRRSCGAIQRRLLDLGVKDRPVRKSPHDSRWTEADFRILADGIREGMSYMAIGQIIGKSEKAIRGKVFQVYVTEKADKIRAYMGDGQWGDGAPVPTVKQGLYLSNTRREVKNDLERLVAALKLRQQQIAGDHGFTEFWQREMCLNWDPATGCTAGGTGCDDCADFRRIPPQYCARCGRTFYERQEARFCAPCRSARRRQAQRRWRREQARK